MPSPNRSACPDSATLQLFLLGRVFGPRAEELEEHVSGCPRCGDAARILASDDELVEAMRGSGGTEPLPQQELIEAVLPLLKRLRPREETATLPPREESGAAETLNSVPAEETFDFLAPPQAPDELGRLGRFRVLRPLGAGGMGVVFLAEDPRLKRQIALKVIRPGLVARADLRERFVREAQAAAAVEHDNIVTVYHVDEVDGVPFLAMPLLRGETLEARLRDSAGPLPLDDVLRIGRETAEGLAAAHARGLVHRDVKPGNIFLVTRGPGPAAEETAAAVPAPAQVKILDFGLAQAVQSEQPQVAGAGGIQGTPAYMAPEQARGQVGDARADLFSLGCVLYRMAAGRPAFQGGDLICLLMSVATEEPTPPGQLNPELPVPLATLIVGLLAKRPEDRPASAQAVAQALRALEEERADAARPRPSRRRWLLLTGAAVLAAAGLTAWLLPRGEEPPPPPDPGEVTFDYDGPDQSLVVQRGGDPEQVLDLKSARVYPLPPGDYAVRPAVEAKGRQMWPDRFHVNAGEPSRVGLRLVGEVRRGHPGSVQSVAMSPRQGSLLTLAAVMDRTVCLWDAATDKDVQVLGEDRGTHKGPVHCVAISGDGRYALSGTGRAPRSDYAVRLWDLGSNAEAASFLGHKGAVRALAFAPDGRRFLSGGDDQTALLWDVPGHRIAFILGDHKNAVPATAFSPDGHRALTGDRDGLMILWDADMGHALKRLEGHKGAVRGLAFAPDGVTAASAGEDGSIRVWDLNAGTSREVRGHQKAVHAVAFSRDGKRLLSGSADRTVRLWDAASGQEVYRFDGHGGEVHGVAFAADGRHAVSGGADRTLRLWELPD